MWNELFITYNGTSLFCELLSNYTRAQDRQLVRILKIKETTCETINLGNLPFIVTTLGEKITSITEIGKFICSLTGTFDVLFGRTNIDIERHVTFINDFNTASDKLEFLNKVLMYNSFCNGYHVTISDIYAFANVLVLLQHIQDKDKFTYSNLFRWAIHVQSMKGIQEQVSRLKLLIYAPTDKLFIEIKKEKNEKHEKTDKSEKKAIDINVNKEKPKETQENKEEKDKKEPKQEKKQEGKETKQDKQKGGKKKEEDDIHPISKLEVRVGRIVSIEENKESDKLYNEMIDIGNGNIRKIASGLKNKIPLEKLKDQLVVVLCNLKERTLCGWPSHGMLLCANKSEKEIDFLKPPSGSNPGDLITFGEFPSKPEEQLNPKKNPWDLIKDKIKINDKGLAVFDVDHVWKTEKGAVTCPLVSGGTIS